ncbi:hypothetical protein [Nocardia sp. NPDC052566]|uniref:hypothetical protein n=1 Tax=Nocardia sp. NPDC052566 TaxID=3364330 RepID=UPI0037C95D12
MIDRSTTRTMDAVPEADYVEQSIPAYPEDPTGSDDENTEAELSAAIDRDAFTADPADIVEQSIPVPLDDERDPSPSY